MEYEIIVIGAGIAGLTAGCLLAKGGFRVLVLEQSGQVGGCSQSFQKNGFVFDWGGGNFRRMYAKFLQKAANILELTEIDTISKGYFNLASKWKEFVGILERHLRDEFFLSRDEATLLLNEIVKREKELIVSLHEAVT